MANIAISELETETTSLNDNDLLLVSKDNGGSFTSAKMKGSVLKGSTGACNFSSDAVKTACQQAIDSKSLSTLTAAQVKTQCSSAISETTISANSIFIDPTKTNGFINYVLDKDDKTDIITDPLPYNSEVEIWMIGTRSSNASYNVYNIKCTITSSLKVGDSYKIISKTTLDSPTACDSVTIKSVSSSRSVFYVKAGSILKFEKWYDTSSFSGGIIISPVS